MKNFDTENNLNPFLINGAFIKYRNNVWKVTDMTKTSITIENDESETKKITDKEWEGIILNKEWLNHFGLNVGSKILNIQTNTEWVIKTAGRYYYLTVKKDISLGENPVIGLKTVHDLQAWYHRLTLKNLSN